VPVEDAGGDGGVEDGAADADGSDVELSCPADMAPVAGQLCMDRYEASRPDATESSVGTDESYATSREGVLPWYSYSMTKQVAAQACENADKRLCSSQEMRTACRGPGDTDYPYGDAYHPTICNGIDAFCHCGAGSACENVSPCPYAHCFNQPPPGEPQPEAGCGASHHVVPTGSFEQCTNGYEIYDLSGNVWELVDDGSSVALFRAGAFNCINSESLHRCDYVSANPSAKGFRCCL